MEETIDFREYIRIIRKRYAVIVMLPIIAVLTSAILSFFIIDPTYEASTTLIVGKVSGPAEGPVTNDYNLVMANKQLAKTYGEIAKSNTVLNKVAKELQLDYSVDKLKDKITVQQVGDTELISIAVQDKSPQEACRIADSLARNFSSRLMEIKKVEYVSLVDKATAPEKAVRPKRLLNLLAAGFLGVITGFGLAFLLEYLDDTIKSSDDIQKYLELPVLGMIPSFNEAKSQVVEGGDRGAAGRKLSNPRPVPITHGGSIPRVTD